MKKIEILIGVENSLDPDLVIVEGKEYPATNKNVEIANKYLREEGSSSLDELDSFTDIHGCTYDDIIDVLYS